MIELKFDHIGIFVKDISIGEEHFNKLHSGLVWSELYEEKTQDVFIKFAEDGPLRYEVIAPRSENSPILNSLKKKTNLLNHLAYRVKNIEEAGEYLKSLGAMAITPASPSNVFEGANIQFWMTALGLIYELIEDKNISS